MACQNCQGNQNPMVYPSTGCSDCNPCDSNCDPKVDTSCVVYTGPALSCSSAPTNITLENLLQIMDQKICSVTGDFTGYNFYCLGPYTTEKEFVEGISQYVCNFKDTFDTFVDVTYPASINDLQNQINDFNNARGITSCFTLGITPSDNLQVVLEKLSNGICNNISAINPSLANWNQCFTISGSAPTTVTEGFNAVIQMICSVKASIPSGSGTLPTFDNTGTCLSSPTASDSLVDTITKIRSRLCLTPTFNAANLGTHSCISVGSSDTLETVLTATFTSINSVSQQAVRQVSGDFTISPIDVNNPCLGQKISLNSATVDRNVALNSADVTPGTLFDKIVAGDNITLDFGVDTPGKLTISSTGGGVTSDEKVKATAADSTAGYLTDKITGSSSGLVSISTTTPTVDKVVIGATLDLDALIDAILTEAETNPVVKARLCTLISTCPVACAAPTNASVSFQTT